MKIQWYPGHMTKAVRDMQEDVKIVDMIIEVVDARAPESTRNPDIDKLGRNKGRIIVLNKSDLSEETVNSAWEAYYGNNGYECIALDARNHSYVKDLTKAIERAGRDKKEKDAKKGIINRPLRAMVAGIPNVGKSTLINSIAGKTAAKTGNKPGVTKGNQWIRLNKNIELMDTPGILWPKFEDEHVGEVIAYLGSVNEMIINTSELAECLSGWLLDNKPDFVKACYGFEGTDRYELIKHIAGIRSCLLKGGEYDYGKAELILINDFRSGKIGRISMERPKL